MALKPSLFPKSDFEVTEGAYLFTNPHFAIPNPAQYIKDDDPEREDKLAKIDAIAPAVVLQIDLLELDEAGEVIDASATKPLRLKFSKNVQKCRPSDEDGDDIELGSDARGAVGRFAVPSSYAPHNNSIAGYFLEKLRDTAGLPEEQFPDTNDASFLDGLKVRLRPVPQEPIKRKNADGSEEEGKVWFHYEPYEILFNPAANSAPVPTPKAALKTVAAKPATGTAAKATAAKPAAAVKPAATAAKPAATPKPAAAPAATPAPAPAADNGEAEAAAVDIISTVVSAMAEAGTAIAPNQVKVRLIQPVMKLDAAVKSGVEKYTKDLAWVTSKLSEMGF